MRLTQREFQRKYDEGALRLAFIGMSNIGKSYTAQRLAQASGFSCYDVDAKIQAQLGISDMDAIAKWMGHPYEDGYAEKAAEYLALETELSQKASGEKGNLVLDTTGSVIHIADTAKHALKDDFLIIYLRASTADIELLTKRYFKHPKPTIWPKNNEGSFSKQAGKTDEESLLDNYPDLLNLRAKLYKKLADITIDAAALSASELNDKDILPLIRNHLPKS